MVIILMGVAGSGKTTVGKLLAEKLGWPFHDADEDHPVANVEKMKSGVPLTAEDRAPWVAALKERVANWVFRQENAVLACSALTEAIRERLGQGNPGVRFVYLKGREASIHSRMLQRQGHFMPPALLKSQFTALEEPRDALVVDAMADAEDAAAQIRRELNL